MQQLRWLAVLYTTRLLGVLALRFESDHLAGRDKVSVALLAPGRTHNFEVPLPAGIAQDVELPRALVKATSLNPAVASVAAAAKVDRRGLLLLSGPSSGLLQCEVESVCRAPGRAHFRLDFAPLAKFSAGGRTPSLFLEKSCTADILHGLNVGQEPLGTDVVKDGQPQWTRRHEPEFPYSVNEVDLYISIGGSSMPATGHQFGFPIVHTTAVAWGLPGATKTAQLAHTADAGAGSIAQIQILSNLDNGLLSRDAPKTVRLVFSCFSAGTVRVELLLSPKTPWEPYRPVSLWLTKTCGGGFKKGFQVGSKEGSTDLVADGVVKGHPSDVDGLTSKMSFYTRYAASSPQDPDQAPKPQLQCVEAGRKRHTSALKMNAEVEEFATSGGGRGYSVAYNCFDRADFECTLRLGLELSQSPQLKWKKTCGGIARPDVIVESSLARYSTVFAAGQPAAAWTSLRPEVILLPEEDDVTFTVHRRAAKDGSKAMVLNRPQVTSSDPDVLEASITNAAAMAGLVLSGDKDGATLLVHHTCKRYGHSMVSVEIPTEDWAGKGLEQSLGMPANMFGPVSFSYHKSCGGAGFMLPSALLGFVSMLGLTCVGIMGCSAFKQYGPDEGIDPLL